MPKIHHTVSSKIEKTFRASKVMGMFDVPDEGEIKKEWDVDLPIEGMDWNCGLIIGPSGTGKTTLSKILFGEEAYHNGFEWPSNQCFLDGFCEDLEVTKITEVLSKIGFASPPSWLLPYDKLSNGQKFRAELARVALEKKGIAVFDEFTSVVDRNVAKIGCAAFSKYLKKNKGKKFVGVSCHSDIVKWLCPDWVYDVGTNKFSRGSLRRPGIKLSIYECKRELWEMFKGNHYLTSSLSNSAKCYLCMVNGEPAGFVSVINFMHNKVKNARREHRIVVLPDYQGIGIGGIISDFVASLYKAKGYRYFSLTSHPALIHSRNRSNKWRMVRGPSFASQQSIYTLKKSSSSSRLTASFEFIGNGEQS
jgi:ABC-type lipoprotein export system ATPase subunit/GNAT superfamily N-acetyltransferase